MESQMVHPGGDSHDQDYPHKTNDPHLEAGGEDENPHEKKSVINRVRARAKKIKDTIKKHVQDHDHNPDNDDVRVPDDHHLDEDDDEDEDMVENPEVQGAPIDESAAVRTGTTTPVNTPLSSSSDHGISEIKETDYSKTSVPGTESRLNMERVPAVNKPLSSLSDHGISNIKESDPSRSFVPGPDSRDTSERPAVEIPPSSFGDHGISNTQESTESKVNLEKPGVNTPMTSFSDHGISNIKDSDPTKTFVPGTESKVNLERPKGLEEDPHAPKDFPHKYTPSNYQTKVPDPTGAGAEEAGMSPIRRSLDKVNIHNESEPKPQENLTNIGSSNGSHDQFSREPLYQNPTNTPPQHPQNLQEHLDTSKTETKPHDSTSQKPPSPTSYTQKISSATSVLADTAISAKNIVVSKLGYGEKNDTGKHETTGDHDTASESASAAGYGKKIAATVTEKLSPVYEKVAGAGSAVKSKRQGPASPATESENTSSGTRGQDKGVSVKDYLAEKLKPGDEDKALSKVISDALHLRKHEPAPEKASESRPLGKVTESEEVKRSLGTGDERNEEEDQPSYVNKIRGTVGSWFGSSGDQSKTSQDSPGYSQDETGDKIHGKEERRLQESGN